MTTGSRSSEPALSGCVLCSGMYLASEEDPPLCPPCNALALVDRLTVENERLAEELKWLKRQTESGGGSSG